VESAYGKTCAVQRGRRLGDRRQGGGAQNGQGGKSRQPGKPAGAGRINHQHEIDPSGKKCAACFKGVVVKMPQGSRFLTHKLTSVRRNFYPPKAAAFVGHGAATFPRDVISAATGSFLC
jgi:hypothetical protein